MKDLILTISISFVLIISFTSCTQINGVDFVKATENALNDNPDAQAAWDCSNVIDFNRGNGHYLTTDKDDPDYKPPTVEIEVDLDCIKKIIDSKKDQ